MKPKASNFQVRMFFFNKSLNKFVIFHQAKSFVSRRLLCMVNRSSWALSKSM